MTRRSCTDLAIVCPDISCPKCSKPYQTWVWKDNLLFTCPDCSELGFSIEEMSIDKKRVPRDSFFSDLEMPCLDNPDPSCTKVTRMLFIENFESLDFLTDHFKRAGAHENYSQLQKSLGQAYEMIIDRITA
ncbi:MAG: hypothetical protein ACMUHM_00280 [Thermoplasmatota archaeon]